MDSQVRIYNTQIRELLDLVSSEIPDHPVLSTIRRKLRVALTTDRTFVIQETGPELWIYRDYIAEDRWDELVDSNWEGQIDSKKDEIKLDVDTNSLKQIVNILREVWKGYGDEERKYIKKSMKKLLSTYIKFLKAKSEDQP